MKRILTKIRIQAETRGAYGLFGAIAAAVIALCCATPAHAVPRAKQVSISGFVIIDTGAPITAHSTIDLIDSAGNSWTTTTTAAGVYKADTTGKVAPILINAAGICGYSETGSGVANVTPLTDAVLNQIYQSLGTSCTTAFGTPTEVKLPAISLTTEWSLFKDVFQQPYAFYKIPATYEPFTTKFSYTGAYKDFFGNTTFTGFGTPTQTVTSTLGTLDWDATLTANSSNQWSSAVWYAQQGATGPYSGSYGWNLITTDPNAGATYAGVNNFYTSIFLPVLKHEGKLLDYTNLIYPKPFYDTDFLNGGKGELYQSYFDATVWRPDKFLGVKLGRIFAYTPDYPDSSHNVIGVAVDNTINRDGGTFFERALEYFICGTDGSGCVLYGDQQYGDPCTSICNESCSLTSGSPITTEILRGELTTPSGTFLGVDLTDDHYFTDAPMNLNTISISLIPTHDQPPTTYMQDDWSLRTTLSAPYNYNDQFSYFADEYYTYNSFVLGYTTEPVNWISPATSGSHLLSDFKLGSPITVKFSPPLTYSPLRVTLGGTACNATQSIELTSVKSFISPTDTSASIIVPKQVDSSATTGFELRLQYEGLYGQRSSFAYGVGTKCSF